MQDRHSVDMIRSFQRSEDGMQHLGTRQRNNLLTGNDLTAEIPASSKDRRAFVTIHAYRESGRLGGRFLSKFLNADHSDVRFWLRKYEIDQALLEVPRFPDLEELHDHIFEHDIKSIEALKVELARYLDDFSQLGSVNAPY